MDICRHADSRVRLNCSRVSWFSLSLILILASSFILLFIPWNSSGQCESIRERNSNTLTRTVYLCSNLGLTLLCFMLFIFVVLRNSQYTLLHIVMWIKDFMANSEFRRYIPSWGNWMFSAQWPALRSDGDLRFESQLLLVWSLGKLFR